MNWINALSQLSQSNQAFVIVTILSVEGSAPRDAQTKMIVDNTTIHDTIGGGNLEYQAITKSRELLLLDQSVLHRETFSLGKDLTQCCGGKVELLFEVFPVCDFTVVVLGAGHVGKALVAILSELNCRVHWVDSRPSQFPQDSEFWAHNTNVQKIIMEYPDKTIESCPANSYYLIVTHSHETDFEFCEAILSRHDSVFCGLIGSKSKAAKFRNRLSRKKFTQEEINQLTSPVGLADIPGKAPMAVAVSISAQLLQLNHQRRNRQLPNTLS
ncbi:MAG: xanthine dehydrogenase accessory protein XdhC [Gammaproteobacteria bacterium]|nr:xanthine dehydrogenase accessory protein XdhC [Gammaproteobacteria bacterium]